MAKRLWADLWPLVGLCLTTVLLGTATTVDIAFDKPNDGFFMKSAYVKHHDPNVVERTFMVNDGLGPHVLRSSLGPFEVYQTVPAHLLDQTNNATVFMHRHLFYALDVSVHIITKKLTPKWPQLQVLIHTAPHEIEAKKWRNQNGLGDLHWCGQIYALHKNVRISSVCVIDKKSSACAMEIQIPREWWHGNDTSISVYYAISHAGQNQECASASNSIIPGRLMGSVQTNKEMFITTMPLLPDVVDYHEYKQEHILIHVPTNKIPVNAKFQVPIKLEADCDVQVFIVRAKTKKGLRIVDAKPHPDSGWEIDFNLNKNQQGAMVTAFVKEDFTYERKAWNQDVFTWQFEVDGNTVSTEGRIIWSIEYELTSSWDDSYDGKNSRVVSPIPILQPGYQDVKLVPVFKISEVINTAILTGKIQRYPLQVFSVDKDLRIWDITQQASCDAEQQVLKVKNCSVVYVDGSETEGSHNATITVKYGDNKVEQVVRVWIPEERLRIDLSDYKLSQIKGWKVRSKHAKNNRRRRGADFGLFTHNSFLLDQDLNDVDVLPACHLRYQQAVVDVYTRFYIQNGQHRDYYGGKKDLFLLTDLLRNQMRLSDKHVATLNNQIIQGQRPGKTRIQILSPRNNRVLAAREIQVGKDKVSLERFLITMVAGIKLEVKRSDAISDTLSVVARLQDTLQGKYQEGILDVSLEFSDKTRIPLKYANSNDYSLDVTSLNHHVVGVAPFITPAQPRIVALGQGKGELIKAMLRLSDRCVRKRSRPLAVSYVHVDVDFSQDKGYLERFQSDGQYDNHASDRWEDNGKVLHKPGYKIEYDTKALNGGGHVKGKMKVQKSATKEATHVIPIGIDLANLPPSNPRPDLHPEAHQQVIEAGNLSSMEVIMYVLLAVFCVAIIVFMVNCVVFMIRYRRKQMPKEPKQIPVANASDWVWIGRATLERNAVNTRCSNVLMPEEDFNGNQMRTRLPSGTGSACSTESAFDSNRNSMVSTYKGSECSIRITNNPLLDNGVPASENTATMHSDGPEWDYEAMGMNYDQLMDYFDNLKESTA